MRKGFSLLTAIIFLILIASIGALSLSFSTYNIKQRSNSYLYQQSEFLIESAISYSLLALSGFDYTQGRCLENITLFYPNSDNCILKAVVSISYIGSKLPCNSKFILENNLSNIDSNRTVVMDILVSSENNISSEPIRLHRRTIQKP